MVAIRRLSINTENKKNKEIISEIYNFMKYNYRNEYVYKNTLLNNLLLHTKNHSVEDTIALTEIPVGKAKADFILINGRAEVYEIKTELDNFNKLEKQIQNYYRAFDRVNIVTSPEKYNILKNMLKGTKVGICVLNKNLKLTEKKKAKSEKQFLEHRTMFKILRKHEYENILINYFNELPFASQFDAYKECYKKILEVDILKMYNSFIKELKKRCVIEKSRFYYIPRPVNSLIYFSNTKKTEIVKLKTFFDSVYTGGESVLSIS